ncbi:dihydropteroate synthase [Ponticoccus litoralis]|uniref:Dihydropteroate synthase n=1 Tax=Ponticoccus litoralis TaxID=422297 RepID=A0AAW9SCW7_9RHOB
MTEYYRPIVRFGPDRPEGALPLAGGPGWFTEVQLRRRDTAPRALPAQDLPPDWRQRLTAPRAAVAGLDMGRANVMGILNVTPDSFSDGGSHQTANAALHRARGMVAAGVDMIDVGGESTRPGAATIPPEAEIARIEPVIRAIGHEIPVPVSIDTRKSSVAEAAVEAGAALVNDVSGFTYDPMLGRFCQTRGLPVCVMHALGDPETMQDDPRYDDVLLDVYDFLERQVSALERTGIPRDRIVVDPGIGFGKTMAHNLTLLHNVSLFHGMGCPVLVGASRKGFIGTLSGAVEPSGRVAGSLAAALAAAAQGVQIVRVHDVTETVQALKVWRAIEQAEA